MADSGDLADLGGRTALVTGAGQVGATLAVTLARHGAGAVAIVDIDRARAEEVAAQVDAAGAKGLALQAELTDPVSVQAMAEAAGALGRPIDILVNNAGMPPGFFDDPARAMRPFAEQAPTDWAPLHELSKNHVQDDELVFTSLHYLIAPAILGDTKTVKAGLDHFHHWSNAKTSQGTVAKIVGETMAKALAKLASEQKHEGVTLMQSVQNQINRIGGSHAQRHLFDQSINSYS